MGDFYKLFDAIVISCPLRWPHSPYRGEIPLLETMVLDRSDNNKLPTAHIGDKGVDAFIEVAQIWKKIPDHDSR